MITIQVMLRCLLIMLFLPFSALDKLLNFSQAVGQAGEAIRNRSVAAALIFTGFCVEVVTSLAIVTGMADRLAALVLAGYCIVTALLWKQFWKASDFKLKGVSRGRDIFWDFLKNCSLAGGFLLLALGPQESDLRSFLQHPLQSSHPYAAIPADGATVRVP